MTREYQLDRFRPLWVFRLIWLLALAATVWRLSDGSMARPLLIAIGIAVLLETLMLALANLERLPTWHDLLSGGLLLGLLTTIGFLRPELITLTLLFAVIPLLELALSRGWQTLLFFLIFPFPLLVRTYVFGAPIPVGIDEIVLWTVLVELGLALGVYHNSVVVEGMLNRQRGEKTDSDIIARVAQMLVKSTNYTRILESLVRGGAEYLDRGTRRHQAKGMAFIFKPGVTDALIVAAAHKMEETYVQRTYGREGVIGTLLQDGEPIETDGSQPPFDGMRALKGHRVMLFPLRTGIDVYGGVMFATRDRRKISNERVQRTLIALADQASLALHNAVLQQELYRNNDQRLGGEEEARHQLARQLHDGPVQRVAAISMQLEFIKALMTRQPERALGELEQLKQVARQASQEMRTLLFTLRPVVLESEGLVAALQTYVERLREQDGLQISFEADPLPRLHAKIEEVAFAIMQEAIGNARKYAKGHPIYVRVIKGNKWIVCQVEDDGPGFDLQAVTLSYATRASLGLLNMQERASMVGGEVKIDTAPGKGTVVSLAVPARKSTHVSNEGA